MTTATMTHSILVIDDDPDICIALRDLLEHDGFQVDTAETCRDAIAVAKGHHYNAVLLDLDLPDGDGLSVLRVLQEVDPSLPVVILTAFTAEERRVDSRLEGAFDYLTKPYNREELRAILRRAVGVKDLAIHAAHVQDALSESEERFRSLVQSASDAIVVADEEGRVVSWNRAASDLFGYQQGEIVGRPLTVLMPERYRKAHEHGLRRFRDSGESRLFGKPVELEGLRHDGTEFPIELSLAAWKTRSGSYFSGIIRDISERKRVEASMEQFRRRYELILSEAGEGIYGLDRNGCTTFVNPVAATLLGYTMEELLGQPMHQILHHSRPDGTPYPVEECPVYAALRDGCTHRASDEVFWRKDGTSFPVEYVSTPIREYGELAGAVIVFKDITERKRAEKALQESEERFREVAEHIRGVFWTTDPSKTRMIYVSPAYEEIWGRSRGSLYASPLSWIDAIHPEDRDRVRTAALTGQVSGEYDERYRIIRPDGSVRWVWDRAFPIRDASGEVCRITGIAEDMTEHKTVEDSLLQTKNRLQAILDYTDAVVYLKDLDGRYLLVNRRWEIVFGKTAAQVMGKTPHDIFPKEVAERFLANDRRVLEADVPIQFEERFPHHDGLRTYLSTRFPLRDSSGVSYGVCGISTDISDRKRTEDALRLSEERLSLAMAGSTDGFWDGRPLPNEPWNSPRTPVWWSPRVRQMLGVTEEEFPDVLESWSTRLHPEDRGRVFAALAAHLEQRIPYDIEYRLLNKQGQYRWVRARGQALWDEQGRPVRMAGTLQCITDRKETELALRESQERFRQLTEYIREVFWLSDPEKNRIIYISPAYEEIWGRSCRSLYDAPRSWLDAIHPDDRARVLDAALTKQVTGEYDEEYRIVRPDGSIRWIRDRAFPVHDASGTVYRIAGIAEDLTRRKEMEDELRLREERLRLALGTSDIGIWDWNVQTGSMFWSEQVEALFGLPAGSFAGTYHAFLDLIDPKDRNSVLHVIQRALDCATDLDVEHRATRPDSSQHRFHWCGRIYRDTTGTAARVLGTVRDVSGRK
jgi:PAS domain S-box-containing protein